MNPIEFSHRGLDTRGVWGSWAVFSRASDDKAGEPKYRYMLCRAWRPTGPTFVWIMLNPSTANEREDDPTLRRVMSFSRRFGAATAIVVNLFALRTPYPHLLAREDEPIGEFNEAVLRGAIAMAAPSSDRIAAWGNFPTAAVRKMAYPLRTLVMSSRPSCLGRTAREEPRHPLMLGRETERALL